MKRKREIKEILLMENKIFTTIHTIALILIFSIIILISILKYTIDKIDSDEQKNFLEDIKTEEDSSTDKTTSTPYDKEEVLLNPGKGMVYYGTKINSQYSDIINVGYARFNWCDIEPEEGKYNWKSVDNAINSFATKGKKFAFGIKCASTSTNIKYVTPKWVFDAGANYIEKDVSFWITGQVTAQAIPDWTDKIFLEKLNNFIEELGKRYDGNPNISYIDIRSYGNYGEQNLGNLGGEEITNEQLIELYIKPYKEAFKKTLLVNPYGNAKFDDVYDWSIENGISIRSDGILYGNSKKAIGKVCLKANGILPSIFEYAVDYENLKAQNFWSEERLLNCIETGKPSYLQFEPDMYKENENFMKMIANRIGYYFKFKGAEYKNKTTTKEETEIKLNFINEGVAPLYEPCTVYIGLLNKDYKLVKKYKTDIDAHTWMPNEEKQENINLRLDDIENGEYIISLGLFLNENDAQPAYLLGNTGGTDDKWYVFGKINITNPIEEDNNTDNNNSDNNNTGNDITNNNNTGNNDSENNNGSSNNNTGNNGNTNNNEISIEEYLANNPVEIKYSETEITNKNIVATIQTNAEIQITNNNGNKEHTFEENGTFTYEYTIKGQAFTKTAEVKNIDKDNPEITGVENGKIYKPEIEINVIDENLSEVKIILNEEEIEYKPNMKLEEEGFYTITAKDKAGNITSINVGIFSEHKEYQIKEETIQNIINNTKRIDFEQKLNLKTQYEIIRNDRNLEDDDIIATGDILKTSTGEKYTLIVTGDINKDGDVNIKDLIKMRKYLLERNNLDETEKLAADCNLDGDDINIKDFIRMRIIALTKVYK